MNQEWFSPLTSQGLATDGDNFGQTTEELQATHRVATIAPLLDSGLIRVGGADARLFLHNLLTNDIANLATDSCRLAGLCSAKGRLLALMRIWRDGDDYLLLLPRDILPGILKKLAMYILRSKVKLSDASAERALIGIAAPAAALSSTVPSAPTFAALPPIPARGVAHSNGAQLIRLDETRWILACAHDQALTRWQELRVHASPVGLAAWRALEIAAAEPRVVAATQEAFVPQMLNLELPALAGVSFNKGCYPGQEIVARTQYLGKIKRRTYRAHVDSDAPPGAAVYASTMGDQACGALISIAPSLQGGFDALVCLQSNAVAAGTVRLGSVDGPTLQFLPSPYPLD
ncbi:MAG TPA: folate-binding protein [Rhodocyclaceae bacterium]|nr:folate-binding protein [Rhodocyclaceae bacterium]